MGFLENIADSLFKKYFKDSKVICKEMEIIQNEKDPDHPILMKGIDCVGTAGPLSFKVPKAYTSAEKIDLSKAGLDNVCKDD